MASAELLQRVETAEKLIKTQGCKQEYADALCQYAEFAYKTEKDIEIAFKCTELAKYCCETVIKENTGADIWALEQYCFDNEVEYEVLNLYYRALLIESYDKFESYIYCLERLRQPSKRFYKPRQKTLHIVAQDLEDLDNGKYKFYGLSMPPRVGKSTICILFLSWVSMKRPNSHNAMGGHSGILAKGFYKELLNIISSEEYDFPKIFMYWHPKGNSLRDKSAEDLTITLDKPDRFATITCRGIDGTWTGAVDISGGKNVGYLYVDDLIRDREHSLSPIRMETTWQEYLNKMVDRKNDGAREIAVATRWNVMDNLGRMESMYGDNPLYKFRKIPALDENDESNFDYEINGFSTEYYRDMRERLDDAEWQAKYQQRPYVREGLVMKPEELNYFNGILPDSSDFRNVSIVDVALGGGDSLSMPIGREYPNGNVYVFDWAFNNGTKEQTIPEVVGKTIANEIRELQFEANQGGDLYCDLVSEELSNQGYACSCTHKRAPNNMEKTTKIMAYSGNVKRNFYFISPKRPTPEELEKDKEYNITRYTRSAEYQKAMDEMCSFVSVGKNAHDDAIDSIIQLDMYVENTGTTNRVEAVINPFRSNGYY